MKSFSVALRKNGQKTQKQQTTSSAYEMYITAGCMMLLCLLIYNMIHNFQVAYIEQRFYRWASALIVVVDITLGLKRDKIQQADITAYWTVCFLFVTVDARLINHILGVLGEAICWRVTKIAAVMALAASETAAVVYIWAHGRGFAKDRKEENKLTINMFNFLVFGLFFWINCLDTANDEDPVCTKPVFSDTNPMQYFFHVFGQHALVVFVSAVVMMEYLDTFVKNLVDVNNVSPFWQTNSLPQTIVNCLITESRITRSLTGTVLAFLSQSKDENMQQNGADKAVAALDMRDDADE